MPKNINLNTALIGLSSNLGDRAEYLKQAREQIAKVHSITAESQIYLTSPWGLPDQPDFYNQCIQIQTSASPIALLDHLQQIENNLKRVRTIKYGLLVNWLNSGYPDLIIGAIVFIIVARGAYRILQLAK